MAGAAAIRPEATADRLVPAAVAAGLLAACAGAWLVLAGRMSGMDGGPGGDPGALGWFALSWAVMSTAMMLPAVSPALLRTVARFRTRAALPFLAGYGAVWMVAGLAGWAVLEVVRSAHPSALAWSSGGRYLAGGAVAAAGLWQFSAAKQRWLARCRGSSAHVARGAGARGLLLAGTEHGGCCVACCWNLMVALYALGMMSIAWMALLTVLIAAERVLPRRRIAVYGAAVLLLVLGVAVAAAPGEVPALTTPPMAMRIGGAMKMKPAPMRMGTSPDRGAGTAAAG